VSGEHGGGEEEKMEDVEESKGESWSNIVNRFKSSIKADSNLGPLVYFILRLKPALTGTKSST